MSTPKTVQHPGAIQLSDGAGAVVNCEAAASDIAASCGGATSSAMIALWRELAAARSVNSHRQPLRCIEPGDAIGALAALNGAAMTGLRAAGFFSGEGLAAVTDILGGTAGKCLPLVIHLAANSGARQGSTLAAGHGAYHGSAASGAFQLFARDVQAAADLGLIAHRIAEMALTPGIVAQDAGLTTQLVAAYRAPDPSLVRDYLGAPGDTIDVPTPAQRILFGEQRRRIPTRWSVDDPAGIGGMRGANTYRLGASAQRAFQLSHVREITDAALEAFAQITGRSYERVGQFSARDADYLLIAQGSIVPVLESVAMHLRKQRRLKVGVLDMTLLRPFPGDLIGTLLSKRKAALVLERHDQPLAGDGPLLQEVRATVAKCLENGSAARGELPYSGYPAFPRREHAPQLFGAIYGLDGANPNAREIVAAVENMLPTGARRRLIHISADFLPRPNLGPQQEILQQTLSDAYPQLPQLSPWPLRDAAPSIAQPPGCVAMRLWGRAGVGAATLETLLAHTLFDLTGCDVQARPAWQFETAGQVARSDLMASMKRLPCAGFPEFPGITVVAQARILAHPKLIEGLPPAGTILVSASEASFGEEWARAAEVVRQRIREREPNLYLIDAERIVRDEKTIRGDAAVAASIVLQGAVLGLPAVSELTGLHGKALQRGLREMLQGRSPEGSSESIEAELLLYFRGAQAVREIELPAEIQTSKHTPQADVEAVPVNLVGSAPLLDLQRMAGESRWRFDEDAAAETMADPFVGSGTTPAGSGMLHDLSARRDVYPQWIPRLCTGCGECWMVCPDSALPPAVNTLEEVLQAAMARLIKQGHATTQLPRGVRTLERQWRGLISDDPHAPPEAHLEQAVAQSLAKSRLSESEQDALTREFALLLAELGCYRSAAPAPFYGELEAARAGSGGLLSIGFNPARCQGCQACVAACPEQALTAELQTPEALELQRAHWAFWMNLPATDAAYIRSPSEIADGAGMETLFLDKQAYHLVCGGSGGAPGNPENVILRLLAVTIASVMRPRITAFLERIETLIEKFEQHIRLKLAVDVTDPESLQQAAETLRNHDFTLSELSTRVDRESKPVDAPWLSRVTDLLIGLNGLKRRYAGAGAETTRAALGLVHDAADPDGWPGGYPFSPFLFPWLGAESSTGFAAACGIFEGHMARMAQGFTLVRKTELELEGRYNPATDTPYFERFTWRLFNDEERALCPPLIVAGDDRMLLGAGMGGLAHLLQSGLPAKIVVLDRGATRHLESPPAIGSVSPPAPGLNGNYDSISAPEGGSTAGIAALTGIAHGNAFVLHSSLADIPRLMQGFMDGLNSPRAAIFDIFCGRAGCAPPHSALAVTQSRMAAESMTHPDFRFDPDLGDCVDRRLLLGAHGSEVGFHQTIAIKHLDDAGIGAQKTAALTCADFVASLQGMSHHFDRLPESGEGAEPTPLAEYLEMEREERRDAVAFIWSADRLGKLRRLRVSRAVIELCDGRLEFWRFLRTLARSDIEPVDEAAIASRAKQEVLDRVAQSLMQLAAGDESLSAKLADLAGADGELSEAPSGETIN